MSKNHAKIGKEYCDGKNVKGLSEKALEAIGANLQKFDEADLDKNGTLDPKEILEKLKKDGSACEADVEKFINDFDKDGDGMIDREEWIKKSLQSWAHKTYAPLLTPLAKQGKVGSEDLIKALTNDGYDKAELEKFIKSKGLDEGGIDINKFTTQFFDVDGRH